jgi:hypothetical protein
LRWIRRRCCSQKIRAESDGERRVQQGGGIIGSSTEEIRDHHSHYAHMPQLARGDGSGTLHDGIDALGLAHGICHCLAQHSRRPRNRGPLDDVSKDIQAKRNRSCPCFRPERASRCPHDVDLLQAFHHRGVLPQSTNWPAFFGFESNCHNSILSLAIQRKWTTSHALQLTLAPRFFVFCQTAIDHALAFVGGVMIAVASLELIPEAVGSPSSFALTSHHPRHSSCSTQL